MSSSKQCKKIDKFSRRRRLSYMLLPALLACQMTYAQSGVAPEAAADVGMHALPGAGTAGTDKNGAAYLIGGRPTFKYAAPALYPGATAPAALGNEFGQLRDAIDSRDAMDNREAKAWPVRQSVTWSITPVPLGYVNGQTDVGFSTFADGPLVVPQPNAQRYSTSLKLF